MLCFFRQIVLDPLAQGVMASSGVAWAALFFILAASARRKIVVLCASVSVWATGGPARIIATDRRSTVRCVCRFWLPSTGATAVARLVQLRGQIHQHLLQDRGILWQAVRIDWHCWNYKANTAQRQAQNML